MHAAASHPVRVTRRAWVRPSRGDESRGSSGKAVGCIVIFLGGNITALKPHNLLPHPASPRAWEGLAVHATAPCWPQSVDTGAAGPGRRGAGGARGRCLGFPVRGAAHAIRLRQRAQGLCPEDTPLLSCWERPGTRDRALASLPPPRTELLPLARAWHWAGWAGGRGGGSPWSAALKPQPSLSRPRPPGAHTPPGAQGQPRSRLGGGPGA